MSTRPPLTEPDPDAPVAAGTEAVAPEIYRRRRLAVLALGGAVVLGLLVSVASALRPDAATPPRAIPLDTWVPYWTLDESLDEWSTRADALRETSPFWYSSTGAESIVVDPNAPADAVEEFLAAARRADARVVPSIVDGMPAGGMAAVLADPTTRAAHVAALRKFAADGEFTGLDLDYEQFAFADDRSTWATTRPNWVAFIGELAAVLHDDDRTLAVSIPPVYDAGQTEASGYWVYDYAAIAPLVDSIRVMAYDYSTSSAGPVAPLEFVERAIAGTVEASGAPEKLVLGIPLYGYNWPVATTGTCPTTSPETGRTSVTARNVADLAARRGGAPVYDAVTGEWSFAYDLVLEDATGSCTQRRQVHYVAADGAIARIRMAHAAGFGGVSLWALGYEDPGFWTEFAGLQTELLSGSSDAGDD